MIDRQWLALGGGVETVLIDIRNLVSSTTYQGGLVILTFDLLTPKVVSESCVTWATYVPILVFLGLSILDLGSTYATDVRQLDVRQKHRLMPPIRGGGKTIKTINI